jgi:NAD(P)-dependent dehydrogenase (short-subunit alcohol dehydrogenase family)
MASRGAALVTGGARRIGRALVATAAEAGYDVAIHVRTMDDEAESAAGEVRAHGRKATILTCDLRKESESVALIGQAEAELGPDLGVGGDTAGIVVRRSSDQARTQPGEQGLEFVVRRFCGHGRPFPADVLNG